MDQCRLLLCLICGRLSYNYLRVRVSLCSNHCHHFCDCRVIILKLSFEKQTLLILIKVITHDVIFSAMSEIVKV